MYTRKELLDLIPESVKSNYGDDEICIALSYSEEFKISYIEKNDDIELVASNLGLSKRVQTNDSEITTVFNPEEEIARIAEDAYIKMMNNNSGIRYADLKRLATEPLEYIKKSEHYKEMLNSLNDY